MMYLNQRRTPWLLNRWILLVMIVHKDLQCVAQGWQKELKPGGTLWALMNLN